MLQIYLYGPHYDTRKFWSANSWGSAIPEVLLMYRRGERRSTSSSSRAGSAVKRRKVAAADDPSSPSALQAGMEDSWYVNTATKQRSRGADSESTRKNKQFSAFKAQQQEESGSKRKRIIELSESEEEETATKPAAAAAAAPSSAIDKKPSSRAGKGEVISIDDGDSSDDNPQPAKRIGKIEDSSSSDSENGSDEESSNEGNDDVRDSPQQAKQWWEAKWSQALSADPDSTWNLATHCKNRTHLYHTLLHYKFRLMLKVRERGCIMCHTDDDTCSTDQGEAEQVSPR